MTDFRIGHGYDVHALDDGLRLVLGGVEIPHAKGCVAHSDGDVAIHALCDALLGALALGDIGHLFPDSSEEFAGIDSRILLSRVMRLVRSQGWELGKAECVGKQVRLEWRHREGGDFINLPDNLYNPCFSTAIGLLLFALNYSEKKPNKIISKPASSGTSFGRILDWLKQSF